MHSTDELINASEAFVRQELTAHDGSHDFWHITRVRNNVKLLSGKEGLAVEDIQVLELCALLHDVKDWKYSGSDTANEDAVKAFLSSQGAPDELIQQVLGIIATVGFKDELAAVSREPPIMNAILQDADRLDAIGAVGVARCLTFGGHFNRVLHDPSVRPREGLTKEQYMAGKDKATTINHFYEKLLKLKDMMKTKAGKEIAEQRHAFMVQFLEQFHSEWNGKA